MNIAEYYGTNPPPPVKTVLNYLSDLANNTGHNIAHWNLEEIFVVDGALIGSPKEINKRFFERVKVEASQADAKLKSLTPEQVETITKFETNIISHQKRLVEDQMEGIRSSIRDYCSSISQQQKRLAELYLRKETIKLPTIGWVNDTLGLNFFELHELGSGSNPYLVFTTRPVVLSQTRGDGVELRVPFGRFKVIVEPMQSRIYVQRYENNVTYREYYHPFINKSSAICWGTAQQAVADMIASGQWFQVMRLLSSLLTTYPGGTPYVALDDFYFKGKDSLAQQPWIDPRHIEKVEPPPASCRWCADLDVEYDSQCSNPLEHRDECDDCGSSYSPERLAQSNSRHRCTTECGECGSEYFSDEADDHECESGE